MASPVEGDSATTVVTEHRRTIYRCLRVPQILRAESQAHAAAATLLVLAGVPKPSPEAGWGSDVATRQREDALAVIDTVCRQFEAGELDPFTGGFGYRGREEMARRLLNSVQGGHSVEALEKLTDALLGALVAYVRAYPLGESVPSRPPVDIGTLTNEPPDPSM